MQRIKPKENYSTPELALILGVSARTLESWRRCQTHPTLRWRRVGRHVTYLGADVLEFLSDTTNSPKPRRRHGA
jgi:hypothetical protein